MSFGLVAASCLALGGVHPPVIAVGCLGLSLAIVGLGPRHAQSLGAAALLALGGVCALQCVPLPLAWLRLLSDANASTWAEAQRLVEHGGAVPISIEPEGTRFEVAKFALYAGLWWTVSALPGRLSLKAVAAFVAALALGVLLLTALHTAVGASRVYGWYAPQYPTGGWLGPLLNENTLCGLLNLGAFGALALAFDHHAGPRVTSTAAALTAVLVGGSLVTGSRGGALSLVLGLLMLAAMLLWKDRHKGRLQHGRRGLVVLAAAATGVSFVALAMSRALRLELLDDSSEKLALARWGLSMALAHPWVGTGRGAFGSEAGSFRDAGGERVYTHAENWIVEAISGWGWLFGLAAVALMLWALLPKSPGRSSSQRLALSLGVLVVAAQNLVDLGLDAVPGLALPFVLVLAALRRPTSRPGSAPAEADPEPAPPNWRERASFAFVHVACGRRVTALLLALAGSWVLLDPPALAHVERRELGRDFNAERAPEERTASLHAALLRHPGDGFLLRLGAADALARSAPNTLAWLNASLRREPHFGRTYLLLAEALRTAGHVDQALIALRYAAKQSPQLTEAVGERVAAWSPESAATAVPEGSTGVELLLRLASEESEPARALALLEQAARRAPDDERVQSALAARWTRAAVGHDPPCDEAPQTCLEVAAEHLEWAEKLAAGRPSPALVGARARWLLAEQKPDAAYELLRRDCSTRAAECGALLLEIAAELSTSQLSEAAKDYVSTHCGTPEACAEAEGRVARLFESRGALRSALEHAVRAAETLDREDLWTRASQLAERLELPARARRLRQRAERASQKAPAH